MFLVPLSPAMIIIVIPLICFWLNDLKVDMAIQASHREGIARDLYPFIRDVEDAYYRKFGVRFKIRPVDGGNLKETKKLILRIKKDFDNNTPKGNPTHCNNDVKFPTFVDKFKNIKI